MTATSLRFALRMLKRDWRAGELRVLIAALILAAASVGTVGFFADRVKGALSGQANLLLGADLMLTGDRPLGDAFEREAKQRGLAAAQVLKFNSMVQADRVPARADAPAAVLADVKAVTTGYPLRGAVLLVDPSLPEGRAATTVPASGQAWIDTRLASRLGLAIGDAVAVGEKTLRVAAIVQQDPEVAGGFSALGPRLLMNLGDVAATNLMQPGNRAAYRLLVAGDGSPAYREWAQTRLERGQRLELFATCAPKCARRWSVRSSSSTFPRWSR